MENEYMNKNELRFFKDSNTLFTSLAQDFCNRVSKCIQDKNICSVVLSGGETPKNFFEKLTEPDFSQKVDWQKIKFFFADERFVPENSEKNNYHMVSQYLFSKVPIKKENIYPISTNYSDAQKCAHAYDALLRSVFHLDNEQYPNFDIIYLGLGDDGHTASLMPFSDVVEKYSQESPESEETNSFPLVESLWLPKQEMYRITLSPPTINHGKNIIFVVNGLNKANAVKAILVDDFQPNQFPAQLIKGLYSSNIWFLDKDAASKL